MWVSSAPVNALMVAKNSPIKTARDLDGKTVAVPGLGTGADYTVRDWLRANGADLATIKIIELPYSAMPAALEAGRIDAAHVAEPFIAVAKANARIMGAADDVLGKAYLRTVWFANAGWAKAHPDLVAKFAAVMREVGALGERQAQLRPERRHPGEVHADRSDAGQIDDARRLRREPRSEAAAARDRLEREVRGLYDVPGSGAAALLTRINA